MESFKKGEDISIDLEWKGADDQPVLPSSLVDYEIKVYSMDDNTNEVLVFAKDEVGAEKPIEVVSDPDGEVRIKFDRTWSAVAEATNYIADIYWYYNEPQGVDGKDLEIISGIELFELQD